MHKPKIINIPENPTDDQREKLFTRAYNYCVWSLASSNKTSKQISDKLIQKGYTEEYVTATINKLVEDKYIDDENFAYNYVEYKINSKGKQAINYELTKKGISKEIINKVFDSFDNLDEIEYEQAEILAKKKAKSYPAALEYQKKLQRLAGVLARQGYNKNTYQIAKKALDEIEQERLEDEQ